MAKEDLISLASGVIGAIVGFFWGLPGVILGALVAWLIPFAFFRLTEFSRLKVKIVRTLTTTDLIQVRDVMRLNGIFVPTDCFTYKSDLPFVRALAKYRKAFTELEGENQVVHSKQASINHGYVDPPYDWVNEWSGKAYQKVPKEHLE